MDANSMNIAGKIAERKKRKRMRRKLRKRANNKDEQEIMDPTNRCLDISNNGKSCITAEMGTLIDVNLTAQSLSQEQSKVDTVSTEILVEKSALEQPKVDTVSTEILVGKSATRKKMRRKLRRRANNKNEPETVDSTNKCLDISTNEKSCTITEIGTILDVNSTAHSLSQEQSKVDTVSTEILVEKSAMEQPQVDTVSTEILVGKSATRKKMRRKLRRRANNKNEPETVDSTNKCLDISTNEKSCTITEIGTILDVNSTAHSLSQEQSKVDTVSTEILVEKSAMEQPHLDTVLTEILVEKRAISKRMRRKLRRRANNKDELEIVNQTNKCLEISDHGKSCIIAEMGTSLDVNSTAQSLSQEQSEVDTVSTEIVVGMSAMEQSKVDSVSAEILVGKSAISNKKRRRKKSMKKKVHNTDGVPSMDQGDTLSNLSLLDECNGRINCSENSSDKCRSQRKCPSEHTSSAIMAEYLLKDSCQLPKKAPSTHSRRILLILDVNGLLADIVMPPPKERKSDINILRRAIFKRPYCDDFLKFCFETFDVGIWSSRSKRIIDRVVDYLLGDLKHKLLFCWDMFHSTKTEFKTLDNKQKPLVCKELRKLWEKCDPNLPWKKGDYDESNTLLIDDSPYKALLNPMCTAIFPHSYTFKDQSDNALGPGGDLRVYLQDLAKTENVQKYVEQHPFGQSAINDKSSSWSFYSRVLHSLSQPSSEQFHPQFTASLLSDIQLAHGANVLELP